MEIRIFVYKVLSTRRMGLRFPVEIFPILSAISIFVGLSITYGIAVGLHHIKPFVPYISYTGTYGPENGIFTIVMFIVTFLLLIVMLIRFKQVSDGNYKKGIGKVIIHIINWVSALCGVVSGLGTLIVGSYSYRVTDNYHAHNLGVIIGLWFLMIYILLQTGIGPFIRPILRFRWLVLVVRIIIIISIIVSGGIFMSAQVDELEKISFIRNYLPKIMEWVLYGLLEVFFLTFIPEFRKLNLVFHFEFKENRKIRMEYDNTSENLLSVKLLEN